jgi:hypothetical protein
MTGINDPGWWKEVLPCTLHTPPREQREGEIQLVCSVHTSCSTEGSLAQAPKQRHFIEERQVVGRDLMDHRLQVLEVPSKATIIDHTVIGLATALSNGGR